MDQRRKGNAPERELGPRLRDRPAGGDRVAERVHELLSATRPLTISDAQVARVAAAIAAGGAAGGAASHPTGAGASAAGAGHGTLVAVLAVVGLGAGGALLLHPTAPATPRSDATTILAPPPLPVVVAAEPAPDPTGPTSARSVEGLDPERTIAPPAEHPPRRVRPTPSLATTTLPDAATSFRGEARRVRAAQRALHDAHDPKRASLLLADYFRDFPSGAMAGEALYLSMEASAASGDLSTARTHAREYLRRFPSGRFREHAKALAQQEEAP